MYKTSVVFLPGSRRCILAWQEEYLEKLTFEVRVATIFGCTNGIEYGIA